MTQGAYGRDELSPRDQTHPGEMKDADKHQEKAKLRTIRLIEKKNSETIPSLSVVFDILKDSPWSYLEPGAPHCSLRYTRAG